MSSKLTAKETLEKHTGKVPYIAYPEVLAAMEEYASQSPGYGVREALEKALERMERARGILNREDGNSNWGMLDTSDIRTALSLTQEEDGIMRQTKIDIEKLEVVCPDEDGDFSIKIGKGQYQMLNLSEAKLLADYLNYHIKQNQ